MRGSSLCLRCREASVSAIFCQKKLCVKRCTHLCNDERVRVELPEIQQGASVKPSAFAQKPQIAKENRTAGVSRSEATKREGGQCCTRPPLRGRDLPKRGEA